MLKKIIILIYISIFTIQSLFCENVRISQIDNSKLLISQDVKLYVSITDNNGRPISNINQEMFSIYESVDNKNFKKIEKIKDFQPKGNMEEGINFLLLVDNSGSMYYDINGRETNNDDTRRMTYVKQAITSFVSSITNPNDKVGIAEYNSYYTLYSKPTHDTDTIIGYLDEIQRPKGDRGWTEIYSSLFLAIDEFKNISGRKVIIILSDGENMPYFERTNKQHEVFGEKVFKYSEPVDKSQEEGVSIFAINYGKGDKKDENLKNIAYETGGTVFNAYNSIELNNVYKDINEQIQNEYLITYKASMDPADKKYVKVAINDKYDAVRFYFSSTIFGAPLARFNPLILLFFLAALLLLILLSLIKFKNNRKDANLEVLSGSGSRAVTQVFSLNDNKTIIGSSTEANMTITGSKAIKENHATIVYDKKLDNYTIVADGDLTVNNKKAKTKLLEPGDVINVGGTTIVFDKGMMKKK